MTAINAKQDVDVVEEKGIFDGLVSDLPQPYGGESDSEKRVVPQGARSLVGQCTDTEHPTLVGRILVSFDKDCHSFEQWLPCLHGMSCRRGDRVLVHYPQNGIEPIVIGVVDGYKKRPAILRLEGPVLELKRDASIKVVSSAGAQLLEVFEDESGPVVKLLSEETSIDFPNQSLRINAKSIELQAVQGRVQISASDSVDIKGEEINLNS